MKRVVLLITAVLCLALAASANAQTIDIKKIKKILHFTTLPDKVFLDQTQLVQERPEGDKYLAYDIRLPKGWKKVDENGGQAQDNNDNIDKSLNRRVIGKVAQYWGPTMIDSVSRIEVRAVALDINISALNWFLNFIMSNGYTLQGIERVSDRRIESLYVLVEGDTSFIVRTIAEINGPRMVLISYYLPEAHWNEEKAMQEKVIQSFHFLEPEKVNLELMQTYSYLDLLRFDYPVSWKLLAPEVTSTESMNAKLINSPPNDNKTVNGEIDLRIVSTDLDTSLAKEVQELRDKLTERGFTIDKLIEVPEDFKFHDHIYFGRVEVYAIFDNAKKFQIQEYWLSIMAEDRYYYIVSMLTPSRTANFYIWARNTEAFKSVVESLRP